MELFFETESEDGGDSGKEEGNAYKDESGTESHRISAGDIGTAGDKSVEVIGEHHGGF
jgi:hypothetical protein